MGPTGAGKTTVASLLLRFIDADAGRISVGGLPLDGIDRAMWRGQVAWVPQLPHLFHGTVADNIRLARPEAGMDAVIAAARAAHADEFIEALPRGYDTPLGEGGARLSGGQRQRLAIARAFLKDAPVLILDEATASLDARSEALIQDALARLMAGRTVLIIAHRLASGLRRRPDRGHGRRARRREPAPPRACWPRMASIAGWSPPTSGDQRQRYPDAGNPQLQSAIRNGNALLASSSSMAPFRWWIRRSACCSASPPPAPASG